MRSNKQSKIKIPQSGFKRSRFNWSHDVNTTFTWGEIQPTQCKMLIPGSKTTMSAQNLIRLAPMVAPTFGRVKFKTYNQFVGLSEIMPNFAALLAEEPVIRTAGKKVPKEVPSTKLGWLSQLCLMGSHATLYWTPSLAESQLGQYRTYHKHWIDATSEWEFVPEIYEKIRTALFGNFGDSKPFVLKSDPFESAGAGLPDVGTRLCIKPRFFNNDFSAIHLTGGAQAATNPRIPLNAMDFSDLIPPAHDTPSKVYADTSFNQNQRLCEVTPENADYVLQFSSTVGDATYYFSLMFEFCDFGKRLRKILQGCGYQIDMTSNEYVSVLPLLAQYKAYYDIFGLQLYKGWETTYAASLINYFEQHFVQKFPGTGIDELVVIPCSLTSGTYFANHLFLQFLINEVCNEWYTENTDFISAHLQKLAVSPNVDTSGFISVNGNTGNINWTGANVDGLNTQVSEGDGTNSTQNDAVSNYVDAAWSHDFINKIQHSEVDAELLKRLYKWTNRNTILGRQIAKLLRAQGLGKYVDECKSNYIGSSDVMITISDVISTSDTENSEGTAGKALGEYGGRGLQYDQSGTLVFENDEYGYWVTLSTIVPEAGYTQGVDPTLKVLDKMNFYNPDFDALGMEITGKDVVVGSSYLGGRGQTVQQVESFGFIPRYSKFKVIQNLVNGDFNRHGLRSTYLPYTLDKQLFIDDFEAKHVEYNDENGITFVVIERSPIRSALPVAGNAWRYPTKYGFLGNYNRIFLNVGKKDDANASSSYNPEFLNNAIGFDDFNNDNFLAHGIYDVLCYAPMKPIEESYGLEDEDPTRSSRRVEFVEKT